jgi:hypothetical protein
MPTCYESIRTKLRRMSTLSVLLAATFILFGCHGASTHFTAGQGSNALVTLSTTLVGDTPPTGISVLSLQVTITDARLNPGNVEALAAPVTIDLTRLRTDTSLLSSLNVAPGTYTSIAITVNQNPQLTFQNNTGSAFTFGGSQCANGAICSGALVLTNNSQSVTLPGAGVTPNSTTPVALMLNLNLTDLLSMTAGTVSMNLNANGAIGAAQLTTSSGSSFETVEDVVGVVSAPANNTFTLQTATLGSYTITVNSSTKFVNFPTAVCASAGFSCLASGEIVSANMSLQPDDTLIATDVFFEDANSSVPEIEGVVVGTSGLPSQFTMVVLQETPASSGPTLGSNVSVALNVTPAPSFAADNLVGAVNYTTNLSFASSADLIIGQEVQVQQGTGSTASLINAKRVLLRSSRITGTISRTFFPDFDLNGLPSFLQNASPAITQIAVDTASGFTPSGTEASGNGPGESGITAVTQLQVNNSLSARGQLFANSGTPTLLATRVVEH